MKFINCLIDKYGLENVAFLLVLLTFLSFLLFIAIVPMTISDIIRNAEYSKQQELREKTQFVTSFCIAYEDLNDKDICTERAIKSFYKLKDYKSY